MNLTFVRVNQAIYYTLEYYELGRIKSHLNQLSNPNYISSNSELLDMYYKNVMDSHRGMDDDITQTVLTCNASTQAYLFVFLKEWLLDWRIRSVNYPEILRVVEGYNERTEKTYMDKIEKEDEEFKQSADYGRDHLEEYETPKSTFYHDEWLYKFFGHERKKVFHKFICREEGPDLIDYAHLPKYFGFVNEIITNFRRVINKHVALYDAGLIVSSVDKITERIVLPQSERLVLPSLPEKIKVNLSVPQLAYLFRLLYEVKPDIFPGLSKADLYRFIAANFTTKGKGDTEISIDSLNNHFCTPEKKTAAFWIEYLKKMLTQSRNE